MRARSVAVDFMGENVGKAKRGQEADCFRKGASPRQPLRRCGRGDEQGELTSRRFGLKMSMHLGGGTALKLGKFLRQLAGTDHAMLGRRGGKDFERVENAVGTLEVNAGGITSESGGEFSGASAFFMRKEAAEVEGRRRQAAGGEGREHGAGARQAINRKTSSHGGRDESLAWIRDRRHARIGDHRHAAAATHVIKHLRDAVRFIVFVEADESGFDAEMLQQHAGVPCILAGNEISIP